MPEDGLSDLDLSHLNKQFSHSYGMTIGCTQQPSDLMKGTSPKWLTQTNPMAAIPL